jgi:hypothetical protein
MVIGGISALFDAFLGSGAMARRLRQHLCERKPKFRQANQDDIPIELEMHMP